MSGFEPPRTPEAERLEAERRAWKSLAAYKFVMFGYWCGVWVHLNRCCRIRHRNPWARLVQLARQVVAQAEGSAR